MTAVIIYSLCMITALGAAVLLFRGYLRSRSKLLFWSSLCFFGLAANNLTVFFDLLIVPQLDLYPIRLAFGAVAISLLLYGLISESGK